MLAGRSVSWARVRVSAPAASSASARTTSSSVTVRRAGAPRRLSTRTLSPLCTAVMACTPASASTIERGDSTRSAVTPSTTEPMSRRSCAVKPARSKMSRTVSRAGAAPMRPEIQCPSCQLAASDQTFACSGNSGAGRASQAQMQMRPVSTIGPP